MWKGLFTTASTTFTLLRRDRIFIPFLISALAISVFAQLASDWGVEEFSKILNDIGFFGFQMTGSFVALFWGTKMVSDSRTEGSIEVELAAPIQRTTWLIGKYLGLTAALLLLGVLIVVSWQAMMLLNDFGWMKPAEWTAFGFTILAWSVLGAVAVMFGCLIRQTVALFVSLALWVTGLCSAVVANTLHPDTPESTKRLVSGIARAWDLQQFNLVSSAVSGIPLPWEELGWRLAYGVLLIVFVLSTASFLFNRRDVTL
jgi:ABC-type transport system involved in multi-copper enzyme maturation permease subunit